MTQSNDSTAAACPCAADHARPTVLVVEDDLKLQKAVCGMIEEAGYHALCVASWQEAARALDQIKPCLVLVDALVPGADRWALGQALQSRFPLATIPVRLVHAPPRAVARVVREPLRIDALLDLVEEHCGPPPPACANT